MLKILVIRACAVGDFVLNLPALRALQDVRPGARFTLVGYPATLELARDFISVDRILSIESQPWSRLFYEPVTGLDYDSAIVWMKDPIVADSLRLSGISDVLQAGAFPEYGHAADHLIRSLGLPRPPLPDLWMPSSKEIVVHSTSGNPKKNWPRFTQLMTAMKNAVPLPQNLGLGELSRSLRHAGAFIGNDSGITHLAAYLGCPTTALFGPTDPRTWGPIGRRCRVIWKPKLEDISVDEVLLTLQYATNTRTGIDE